MQLSKKKYKPPIKRIVIKFYGHNNYIDDKIKENIFFPLEFTHYD